MSIVLVYEQGPNEGPEPRQLGSPFNTTVQPGHKFATEDPEWAAELVRRVPQIKVVSGAPYPGWPGERIEPVQAPEPGPVSAEAPEPAPAPSPAEPVAPTPEESKKKPKAEKVKAPKAEGSASEH